MRLPSVQVRRQLSRFARSRWALSTVVTTLIIIVISVLLAGVVTYFAINVTSTRVQEESLALTKQHVWYDEANGKAQAAIMVINAGGRDVVIDKLTVRGQACDWSKVFYAVTGDSISGDLFYNTTLVDGGSISVGGSSREFKQATGDLTLQSGKTLIIYMSNPDSISVNDVGLTVSVNIFTSQSMYYKETNVQGTGGTSTVSSPASNGATYQILSGKAYATTQGTDDELALIVYNDQSYDVTILYTYLIINGEALPLAQFDGYSAVFTPTSNLAYCDFAHDTLVIEGHEIAPSPSSFEIGAGEHAVMYFVFDGSSLISGGESITVALSYYDHEAQHQTQTEPLQLTVETV